MSTDSSIDGSSDLEAQLVRLREVIKPLRRVLVAFSGGVDSTLVLKVAHDVLGENALAVTAVSPSLSQSELQDALGLARHIGAPHRLLPTHELEDPQYAANPSNRCYFCKTELYERASRLAAEENYDRVLDGTNLDDLGDFRPGLAAAREHDVCSPLKEAGLRKPDVQALARHLGLPNWDKPASPCLSSRIPHGEPVTIETLRRIEQAEAVLRRLGLRQVRVRHHQQLARLEIPVEDFPRLLATREEIVRGLEEAGYTHVTLDLAGFRSGNLSSIAVAVPWKGEPTSP